MCSPCGPMVCYKYEDCGPPKGNASNGGGAKRAEEGGAKKDDKENPLRRIKSRELRGGIMYYSCHCIKRNGLQHDCRRTGCQGEPPCLTLPDPVCLPSQLARQRGLADPAPLAAHMHAQGGGTAGTGNAASGGGKRFIVCELKGAAPGGSSGCCNCKSSSSTTNPQAAQINICDFSPLAPKRDVKDPCPCGAHVTPKQANPLPQSPDKCVCSSYLDPNKIYVFDDQLMQILVSQLDGENPASNAPEGKTKDKNKLGCKAEECTRPGCVHWKPPPPCIWDLPCKADCFETPAGIQPGRNPWGNSKNVKCEFERNNLWPGQVVAESTQQKPQVQTVLKLLMPMCCNERS